MPPVHNKPRGGWRFLYKACLLPSTWPSTRKHSLQPVPSTCPFNLSLHPVPSICPFILFLQSVPSICPFSLSLQSVPLICPFNLSFHSCPFGHGHLWSCPWLCHCHEVIRPCSWSWSWSCLQLSCTTFASVLPVMWHGCIAACVITRMVAEHGRDDTVGSKVAE